MALVLLLVNSLVLTSCLQQYQQTLQQHRKKADFYAVLKIATTQLATDRQWPSVYQYHSQLYRCTKSSDWIRIQQIKTGETIEVYWTSY